MTPSYCDDGNLLNGDGCSSSCQIEYGWSCSGGSLASADTCNAKCGNGVIDGASEMCDDGNLVSGDGCS